MNIYIGNLITTVSTVLVLVVCAYIGLNIINHKKVEYWGRKIAVLTVVGLLVCCVVATRDGYHLSVQASFDETITAGMFTINSIQSILCCIGGAIIAFSAISSIFVKNQKYRKIMFLALSCTIILKTLIIEISRWVV